MLTNTVASAVMAVQKVNTTEEGQAPNIKQENAKTITVRNVPDHTDTTNEADKNPQADPSEHHGGVAEPTSSHPVRCHFNGAQLDWTGFGVMIPTPATLCWCTN